MEESRNQRLQELLRRLGKALHETVVRSDEVRDCLNELHEDGWQAVMMPARPMATLARRASGTPRAFP